MEGMTLIISTTIVICLLIMSISLYFIKKALKNSYLKKLNYLQIELNKLMSAPIMLELSKIEPIIKNEKLEEKYNDWNDRFKNIKEKRLAEINDMIIDLDLYINKSDYKTSMVKLAQTEMKIYKAKESCEKLLEEITEITLSEEKYRNIVIKLKTKYRELNKDFNEHKNLYEDIQTAIALQLENIEKRFLDFEKVMEKNEYSEVVKIVKALDSMINHIEIVIKEVPDLMIMIKQYIPSRMAEIKKIENQMTDLGYPLGYLNIDYNLEEANKKIENVSDKIKMLNLENCMFEMSTMLEYFDSLFVDFEKERISKKAYEEIDKDFNKKLEKTNKLVKDVYSQLEDIKNMYDLGEEDIEIIHTVNKVLIVINDDYNLIKQKEEEKTDIPYSKLHQEMEDITIRLNTMEDDFEKSLKSLGNMYDDEVRAREQLVEIEVLLNECKNKMREYKLPIIGNKYFTELQEANESTKEVIIELAKKPIEIKVLNTRVDTARDLILKLFNTTNEMIKTAQMAEQAIVYSNRYRSSSEELDEELIEAEQFFYKGDYKKALDITLKATAQIDKDIYKKLFSMYDVENTSNN